MIRFPCQLPDYGRVIFYFGTHNCVPCRKLEPILYELEDEFGEDVKFYKCDLSEDDRYKYMFSVMGIPTVAFLEFVNGERIEHARLTGVFPKERYVNIIKESIL